MSCNLTGIISQSVDYISDHNSSCLYATCAINLDVFPHSLPPSLFIFSFLLSEVNDNYFVHCNFVPIRGLFGFSSVRFGLGLSLGFGWLRMPLHAVAELCVVCMHVHVCLLM